MERLGDANDSPLDLATTGLAVGGFGDRIRFVFEKRQEIVVTAGHDGRWNKGCELRCPYFLVDRAHALRAVDDFDLRRQAV